MAVERPEEVKEPLAPAPQAPEPQAPNSPQPSHGVVEEVLEPGIADMGAEISKAPVAVSVN